MNHKKCEAQFLGFRPVLARELPLLLLAVLFVWLAVLPGCNSQGSVARQPDKAIRPISNASRLVQNASYYRRIGRTELAVNELEQARLKEPDNLEILDVLTQCYEESGDFDRAQELYEDGLARRDGHHPALENNRCFSLYLRGRLDQAETCFRQTLARQPDNQKVRNNLGLVLCRQGREAEALSMWREALSDAEARQRMGQALASLGKAVPPSLAGPAAPPAAAPIVAAAKPPASAPTPRTAISAASPPPPPAAQARTTPPSSPAGLRSAKQKEPAPTPPPRPTAVTMAREPVPAPTPPTKPLAAPAAPGRALSLSPDPPRAIVSQKGKAPAPAPLARGASKPPVQADAAALTALDLEDTRIELKNGNGVQHQAHAARRLLASEGFTVVGIGNYIDFGLGETIIAYRPEAARVAKTLAKKFFPGAVMAEGGKLSRGADIRISLGRDRLGHITGTTPTQESPPVTATAPPAATPRVAALPQGKSPQGKPTRPAAPALTSPPDVLTSHELLQSRIDLRNGSGIPGQAIEMRVQLAQEGFTVVGVGNYKDFGLEKTVIAYRPEAARVARALATKFFPRATLEEQSKLPSWANVRVSLGRDLVAGQGQVAQAGTGTAVP